MKLQDSDAETHETSQARHAVRLKHILLYPTLTSTNRPYTLPTAEY